MNTTMHRVTTTKHVELRALADITRTAHLPGWYCSVYRKCGGGFPEHPFDRLPYKV